MSVPANTGMRETRRPAGQGGQSLVELALILPWVLLIAMGVLDFGRAMYSYVAVSNAAQAGAEYAARNPTYNTLTVTKAVLDEGGPFLRSQSEFIGVVATKVEVGATPLPDGRQVKQVTVMQVTVKLDFTPITPLPFTGKVPIQVTAAAPMGAL